MELLGNAIWQLIYQSDKVTWLVLIFLLVLSLLCWTIFFYKLVIWRFKREKINKALNQIRNAKSFEDIIKIASQNSNNIIGYFFTKNLSYLKTLLESKKAKTLEINDREWNFLQNIIDNTIDDIIYNEESYLPILSVSAAVGPLLGLFGTVWGLIHSFVDISKKQSADIATVAPGMAEALITTLAGLIIAIPALMIFYYLKLQLSAIEQSLVSFSNKFLSIVQSVISKTNLENDHIFKTHIPTSLEIDNAPN